MNSLQRFIDDLLFIHESWFRLDYNERMNRCIHDADVGGDTALAHYLIRRKMEYVRKRDRGGMV